MTAYILVIWTMVGVVGDRHGVYKQYNDWRPIGEFQGGDRDPERSLKMCQDAAQQLSLDAKLYRCVRSK